MANYDCCPLCGEGATVEAIAHGVAEMRRPMDDVKRALGLNLDVEHADVLVTIRRLREVDKAAQALARSMGGGQ